MDYDLELDRVVTLVKKNRAKRVCIQLPDGLKPKANDIVEEVEKKTRSKVFIWGGSCYGACDLPQGLNNIKIDLLVQFGHSKWK